MRLRKMNCYKKQNYNIITTHYKLSSLYFKIWNLVRISPWKEEKEEQKKMMFCYALKPADFSRAKFNARFMP